MQFVVFSFFLSFISLFTMNAKSTDVTKRADSIQLANTTLKIINNCNKTIQLGQSSSTLLYDGAHFSMESKQSVSYIFFGTWSGRFWARENCINTGCSIASAANPATLTEFTFNDAGGNDFYDISFVDGYTLPVSIAPISINNTGIVEQQINTKYWCGTPTCHRIPLCPLELQQFMKDRNSSLLSCLSACSRYRTSEYCCSDEYGTPDKCVINKYAAAVKNICPDVYSYAYDDPTSLFKCKAEGYIVTWCPSN
ncbi:MAG: thaumatin [Benjaminiella poitrasii]|nr:MAG: thaumatin [Benjaminiella poitrasii]